MMAKNAEERVGPSEAPCTPTQTGPKATLHALTQLSNLSLEYNSFLQEPLNEPSQYIRLLQFLPGDHGEHIRVSLKNFKKDKAPPFNAISYAWGDEKAERNITVNGKAMNVRDNCHYALQQVRLYDPRSFVWIDSICINQGDLHEKGLQVQMMHSLYQQAAQVLACIGPSADGSDSILELGNHLQQSDAEILRIVPGNFKEIVNPDWRRFGSRLSNARLCWVLSLDRQHILDLNRSMKHFTERPYWRRVWVVQEIAAAQHVVVLCGEMSMLWEGVVRVRDTLAGISDMGHSSHGLIKLDTSAIRNLQMAATKQIRSLQSFLSHFRDSRCTDPRDRLFAFGGLIDWKPFEPVVTDYTRSAFQLLVDLAERGMVSEDLLSALEVFTADPEMAAAVRRRQGAIEPAVIGAAEYAGPTIRYRLGGTNRLGQLERAQSGQLLMKTEGVYAEAAQCDDAVRLSALLRDIQERPAKHQMGWAHRMPQEIKNDEGNLVGWACNEARPGDVLVPCNQVIVVFATTTPYMLVLNRREGEVFDIVGQALLLADCKLPWHGRGYTVPGERRPTVDGYSIVELSISAEDKVVLTGQDLAHGRAHHRQARIERLFTQVTMNPTRVAKIEFHEYTEFEMMNVGASPDSPWAR